jgi:hypothetical protein
VILSSQSPEAGIVQGIVQQFAGLFWGVTASVHRGVEPQWGEPLVLLGISARRLLQALARLSDWPRAINRRCRLMYLPRDGSDTDDVSASAEASQRRTNG